MNYVSYVVHTDELKSNQIKIYGKKSEIHLHQEQIQHCFQYFIIFFSPFWKERSFLEKDDLC